jgi:predicted transcriptional regulator
MRPLKIGIMPQQQIRERTLAIAKGMYVPQEDEPKIWFSSIRSLAEVLSDENQALLAVIRDQKPESLRQLAELTGRHSSNLSRTLKTLSFYGFVTLQKRAKVLFPSVVATQFNVVFGVSHQTG